jgi:phytanoyl-CoA hydroxylase
MEKGAFDKNGNLIHPLRDSINKLGHGMHDVNAKFHKFSYSPEIKYISKALGYVNPIIVQSMYICKSARVGGEVPPHTDNTYIRTNPLSCFGLWVAFDDATKENGGMWGYPGSHKKQTDYFMKLVENQGKRSTIYEPSNPPKYEELKDPVPLEAEKGTVILLHGDFVHFSKSNTSNKQRHAYTLHIVESRNHQYEADNWLQRRENPFKFMYDVKF